MRKEDKENNKEELNEEIETEEDLINMLNQIINDDDLEPKVIIKANKSKGLTIKTFNNLFIDYLYNLILNMALVISLSGWFKVIYFDKFYLLIIFAFVFGTLDYWIKFLIFKFQPGIFFRSFGYIFTLSTTIIIGLLGVVGYMLFDMQLNSAWMIIGCFVLFLIVRAVVISYVKRLV